jgi:hypothetical protein
VPAGGAVAQAKQYLEIRYNTSLSFRRITIWTDNRNAAASPRFTGSADVSAAGLIGHIDSTVTVPVLWQVYDDLLPSPPPFTNDVEWGYVPDKSESGFQTEGAIEYRTLVSVNGLGTRPSAGRGGAPPIVVYFVADFRGKPAQQYSTNRLMIERIEQ